MTTVALNIALAVGKTIRSFQSGRNAAGERASNAYIEPYRVERSGGRQGENDRGPSVHGGRPAVCRPLQPFTGIGPDERAAVLRFLDGGRPLSGFHGSPQPTFFGGPEVLAFEAAWREHFGVAHAVSVNSATSALIAAMGAIGIGPGDEVIVSPYTMTATAVAPLFYGGIPVFADIDPDYFCLDPASVERAITPMTRAIIAVNLFGHPAELTRLRAIADGAGLYLVEDNAQAVLAEENGRRAGTVGHIGIYSLNVHKHIQTGEGGVLVTDDAELAQAAAAHPKSWRERHRLARGQGPHRHVGFNFRMAELTAAVASAQLARVDRAGGAGGVDCQTPDSRDADLPGLTPPAVRPGCRHNYYIWSMKLDAATLGTSRALFSQGIDRGRFSQCRRLCPPDLSHSDVPAAHRHRRHGFPFTLRDRRYPPGLCPVAEAMHSSEMLQFQPVSWDVDDDQVDMLIEAIRKVHAMRQRWMARLNNSMIDRKGAFS